MIDLENRIKIKIRTGIELKEELESKNYIKKIELDEDLLSQISFLGWRVIGEIDNRFIMSDNALFKTVGSGWVAEFYIVAISIFNKTVFLVDSNCPEYLFVDPSSLISPIRDYLEKVDNIMFGCSKIN